NHAIGVCHGREVFPLGRKEMRAHYIVYMSNKSFQPENSEIGDDMESESERFKAKNGSVADATSIEKCTIKSAVAAFDQWSVRTPRTAVWKFVEKGEAGADLMDRIKGASVIDAANVSSAVKQATGSLEGR